jgi:hypothetical protein
MRRWLYVSARNKKIVSVKFYPMNGSSSSSSKITSKRGIEGVWGSIRVV